MPWHLPFNPAAIIGWCIGLGLVYYKIIRPRPQKLAHNCVMAIGDDDEQSRLEAASGKADGASLGRHAAPEEAEVETVRLLITGYGPFRGYPTENPSTLTARHLDGLVLEAPAASSEGRPRKRRVEVTFRSLAVTYAEINKAIPPLHREHAYDAFVHVGVASRARDGLRLEQLGRKGPYDAVDSEKRHCPTDIDGSRTVPGWAAEEDAIRSSLDLPALLAWLQIEQAVEHVRLSSDAGLYLCEFVYATSLNAARQHAVANGRAGHSQTAPCLFVHVPDLRPAEVPPSPDQPVYTELEVASVLRNICAWVGAHA